MSDAASVQGAKEAILYLVRNRDVLARLEQTESREERREILRSQGLATEYQHAELSLGVMSVVGHVQKAVEAHLPREQKEPLPGESEEADDTTRDALIAYGTVGGAVSLIAAAAPAV